MANTKISDLTDGSPAQSTDEVPVARSGSTVRVSASTIASLASGSGLLSATVTLTAAQIKALHATPITLVAAPGAGKLFVPMGAFFQYKHVTTDYTVPVNSRLEIGPRDAVINDYSTWETSTGAVQVLAGKIDGIDYGGFQMGNTGWGAQVSTGDLIP